MTIHLTREQEPDNPNITWLRVAADGPVSPALTQDEATQVAKSLVTSWQLARLDTSSAEQHLIERILIRMGMPLEGLDVLPR